MLLAAVLAGCGQQKDPIKTPKKAAHAANNAPLFHYGNPVLLQYDRYVAGLDTQLIETGGQAVDTFQLLFKAQPPAVCDTAFYIFNQLHNRLCSYLNEHMSADSINYEDFIFQDEHGKDRPLSKKQKTVKKKLDKNGFGLDSEEGTAYIVEDLHFISQHFGKYVTPLMKQYLAQRDKEQQEGFQEDAGLTIKPIVLAERTVWWEQFSKTVANTNFLYTKEAARNYNLLLYVLMEGMANTEVNDYFNDSIPNGRNLSDYFETAWTHVQEKYPQSATNAVVSPYLNAWLKKDSTEISQVLTKFKSEHKSPWEED